MEIEVNEPIEYQDNLFDLENPLFNQVYNADLDIFDRNPCQVFTCAYGEREKDLCLIFPNFSRDLITISMCANCAHYDQLKKKIDESKPIKNNKKGITSKQRKMLSKEDSMLKEFMAFGDIL